jgi:hypothetical protein
MVLLYNAAASPQGIKAAALYAGIKEWGTHLHDASSRCQLGIIESTRLKKYCTSTL